MKILIIILTLALAGGTSHAANDSDTSGTSKKIEVYGFIKAAGTGSTRGVESLGRNNFVAYTAAANPVVTAHPNHGSMAMQVQQSRLGVKTTFESDLAGTIEFDFVDFNKSTPTVASQVRLRRAFVTYAPDSEWSFNVGQDWDLFSPYAPYSYNFIGHYFLSGDVGFMRLQAQALHKGENNESAVALGFPSYDNQSAIGNAEWTSMPTIAVRQTFDLEHWSVGGSAIVGHINDISSDKSITPYALGVATKHSGENDEFVFEGYYGENLENLSLQALSYSPNFQRIKEAGAYATFRQKLESWGWWVGAGYAHVFNHANLTPSYSYATPGAKPTLNLLATSTGYGILYNATFRVGGEKNLTPRLHLYTELAHLYTHHLLDSADRAISPYRSTEVLEVGLKLDL